MRRVLTLARLTCSIQSLLLVTLTAESTQTVDNPIVLENQQPGPNAWLFLTAGDDATGQINGHASATSVNQNENITLPLSGNPPQAYTIDVHPFGWYARLDGPALCAYRPRCLA